MPDRETAADAEFVLGLEDACDYLMELTGQLWTERRAQWLFESGVIPAGRLGGRFCTKRSAIRAALEAASAERVPPRPPKVVHADLRERGRDVVQCKACRKVFKRPSRGRPPLRCPDCRKRPKQVAKK